MIKEKEVMKMNYEENFDITEWNRLGGIYHGRI